MTNVNGFSVRIYIPSGEPEGIRLIEKSNWTGQGFVFPRSLFTEARQRPELNRTGIYILWGPGDSGQLPRVYVGEGDTVLPRLDDHFRRKEFWTQAVTFSSKDQNLNKAHVQYLESRLIQIANEAKRCELDNGNSPNKPALSEADATDAEGFLADILLCLPILGISFFERAKASRRKGPKLLLRAKGIEASGTESPEGFLVYSGSFAVKDEVPSIHPFMSELRRTLITKGVFVDAGNAFKLTQDYTFNSPSTASGILLGRSTNGRLDWKDSQGRSLRDIQDLETGL